LRKEQQLMARKKRTEANQPLERYPAIAHWCNQYGWIEVGYEWQDKLFARAIHEGGLAWRGEGPYPTIDDALRALDDAIRDYMQENDWE
jgi:hypothetical protein